MQQSRLDRPGRLVRPRHPVPARIVVIAIGAILLELVVRVGRVESREMRGLAVAFLVVGIVLDRK